MTRFSCLAFTILLSCSGPGENKCDMKMSGWSRYHAPQERVSINRIVVDQDSITWNGMSVNQNRLKFLVQQNMQSTGMSPIELHRGNSDCETYTRIRKIIDQAGHCKVAANCLEIVRHARSQIMK